jgi:hypothetical protein
MNGAATQTTHALQPIHIVSNGSGLSTDGVATPDFFCQRQHQRRTPTAGLPAPPEPLLPLPFKAPECIERLGTNSGIVMTAIRYSTSYVDAFSVFVIYVILTLSNSQVQSSIAIWTYLYHSLLLLLSSLSPCAPSRNERCCDSDDPCKLANQSR